MRLYQVVSACKDTKNRDQLVFVYPNYLNMIEYPKIGQEKSHITLPTSELSSHFMKNT